MSLPETFTYGGSTAAWAGLSTPQAMVKSNYGKYVSSTNNPDQAVRFNVSSDLRKDGVLDTWFRYETLRNARDGVVSGNVAFPTTKDRNLSVQIRCLAPFSASAVSASLGTFTLPEVIDGIRGMATILLLTDFLEKTVRGEL